MFNVKRLIGGRFDDPEVQADMRQFPFKVFSKDGKPYVEVDYQGQKKQLVSYSISNLIGSLIVAL